MTIIIKYVHILQCKRNMTNINVVTTIFIYIYVLFHYFGKKYFQPLSCNISHTSKTGLYIATWAPEGGNNFITTRRVARPKTCNIAFISNLRNIFQTAPLEQIHFQPKRNTVILSYKYQCRLQRNYNDLNTIYAVFLVEIYVLQSPVFKKVLFHKITLCKSVSMCLCSTQLWRAHFSAKIQEILNKHINQAKIYAREGFLNILKINKMFGQKLQKVFFYIKRTDLKVLIRFEQGTTLFILYTMVFITQQLKLYIQFI